MAMTTTDTLLGGANRHQSSVGDVSGLASCQVWEAGSGPCGESSKHLRKFRVGTLNVNTLRGRVCEVVETLSRRKVDVCCIQETRYRGGNCRIIKGKDTRYKLYWSGNDKGTAGVGVFVAEEWIEKVFEVQRVSDRILLVKLIVGQRVVTLLSVYAPQSGLSDVDKDLFFDQLRAVTARIPRSELLIPCGDWNGHVGRAGTEYREVHGGMGCVRRLLTWKEAMEEKGLTVNAGKTKIMICGMGLDLLQSSGEFPCAVCRTGVGSNSIFCKGCKHWVHKKCSGLKRLTEDPDYRCTRCKGIARPLDGRPQREVQVGPDKLEVVASFCYLGDMLSAAGGCELSTTTRVKTAWKKFKELKPVLSSRHLSFKTRGHVYSMCVRSAMLHASETWPVTKPCLQRLQRNDRAMIRQICNVKPQDTATIRSIELLARLGIEDLDIILKERRLRWYGHVERSNGAVKTAFDIQVNGKRGPGRPKMTWKQLTERDRREWKLSAIDPHDRDTWRSGVRSAMRAASQLPGRGPTVVDMAPIPAC